MRLLGLYLEPEPKRPVLRQVVAGPRNHRTPPPVAESFRFRHPHLPTRKPAPDAPGGASSRQGTVGTPKVEWLGRPDCRRGLIRPPLVPGQNPGSETRQKLVILHGLSSSRRDCSKREWFWTA